MIKANFQLVDFSLKLFLNTKGLSFGTLLSFNGGSNRIHCTGMVFPCVVEVIFFFSFQSTALLIKIMNRASSFSKLVKEIFDFISEIFILAFDNIKLLNSFILSCFQAEQL